MRRSVLLLVTTASLAGTVARAQSQDCENPISDLASCPPCPSSTPLCRKPIDGYEPTVNGCGPEKFSKLIQLGVIPQGYGAADFGNGGCPSGQSCGCNQHDRCYGTCNADKTACDNAFRQDLYKSCQAAYPVDTRGSGGCSDGLCFSDNQRLGICMARATKYYSLVAGLGQSAYDDAQKDACQCCCNPTASAVMASARSAPVNQAGPVCKPPTMQGTAHHHMASVAGDDQIVTDSVATMNMPFDPTSSNSQIWEFTSIGTFHFHYEETLTNCTVTAPDVDGTLTSEAENGGIGVYLVADGIGHVANQYQGSIGAFFNVTVTYSCPPQADRVVVYPWPEEFFVNSTRTDVLSAGTGSGSYEVDVGGGGGSQKSDTYDWNLQVTGL